MIILKVQGATPAEIERGKTAALQVFAEAKMTPYEAACALQVVEIWDASGFPKPVPPVVEAGHHLVWGEAAYAAEKACCAGWGEDRIPLDMEFSLADEAYPPEVLERLRHNALLAAE